MKVLSRKLNQGFWIGESYVEILGRKGNQYKLGIKAPDELLILRDEKKREQDDSEDA